LFIWPADPGRHASALQKLAENVTYLGHSMSPVRIRLNDAPPEATLAPDQAGSIRLRIPERGRLKHLEEVYDLRTKDTTTQPLRGLEVPYGAVGKSVPQIPASIFQTSYVFRLQKVAPPPEIIGRLMDAVRQAVMALYPDPIPEVVSGQYAHGAPSKKLHLAITPLLNVGHMRADGHVMGFALWLPHAPIGVKADLEIALSDFSTLKLGRLGQWDVKYVSPPMIAREAKSLNPAVYAEAHDTWASVTPVIFGHHPKKSQIGPGKDGGRVVAELCERIGLPKPIETRLGAASAFRGAAAASAVAPPAKYDRLFRAHVQLRWAEPVRGPVMMGAGLFGGFGLCRPWRT
jgi:CRISPR-associated protein Csb2